jgi:formyl-CoA transferase
VSEGPLADVSVLDLTVARAGPTCVRQLADWGARVVRIEPPAVSGVVPSTGGERRGSDFQNLHRSKRSLTLDLRRPEGSEIFGRLVKGADVVVENMRPPVKERLGVDYETVKALNPRVVYGSISGFGQSGPYAERAGVDQIAQGLGGLMSVTGFPGQGPLRVGIPIGDLAAGLYLAIGILAALHERQRSGKGQWVHTSLLEAMIAMLDFQATRFTIDGEVPGPAGNDHPTVVPMGCFRTADGYVNVAGGSGRMLERFCRAVGLPEILDDPRFASGTLRSDNRGELNELIGARLATEGTEFWVRLLNEAGVPAGPVNTIDATFDDPQVRHLAMVQPVEHGQLGRLGLIRNPVSMSRTTLPGATAAPEPGEHSDAVLTELGLGAEEIEQLRRQGVV